MYKLAAQVSTDIGFLLVTMFWWRQYGALNHVLSFSKIPLDSLVITVLETKINIVVRRYITVCLLVVKKILNKLCILYFDFFQAFSGT